MVQELQNALGRTYLTLQHDAGRAWVLATWAGYLTPESVRTGSEACTDVIAATGCTGLLNDARRISGPWDHSLDWLRHTWTPSAVRAGLRYFAVVVAPETLAEGTAGGFVNHLTGLQAQVFTDPEAAGTWLRRMGSTSHAA